MVLIINLCLDVQLEILKYLKTYDILQLRNTCKYFTNLIPECNYLNLKIWNIPEFKYQRYQGENFDRHHYGEISLSRLIILDNILKKQICQICNTFKNRNNQINLYRNYPIVGCRECMILRSVRFADSNRNFGFPYNCDFPNTRNIYPERTIIYIHHDKYVLQRDIIEYVNKVLKIKSKMENETFVECKTYLEAKKKALQVKEYVKQYRKKQKKMELKEKEIEYNKKSQYDQIMYKRDKLYNYWTIDNTSMNPSVTNDLERIKDIIDTDGGIDFLYSKQCDIKKSIKGYLKSSYNRMPFWERKINNEELLENIPISINV